MYLLMVLVAVFMLTLLNVDTFLVVRGKNRAQNAGDAATLAAARKQGLLLNRIGRMNIDHLFAAAEDDARTCEEIVEEQRRLALLGPVDGLRLANNAARKNGMAVREEFSEILRDHVNTIRTVYSGGTNEDGEPYPEPYPGAWVEYATAIENVISEGLACGPDNVEFYGARGGHMLLTPNFYHAIAGRDWCWFHSGANAKRTGASAISFILSAPSCKAPRATPRRASPLAAPIKPSLKPANAAASLAAFSLSI